MASANLEFDPISEASESCVEPKGGPKSSQNKKQESDDIRAKAFVPKQLPKDFLRVVLDEKQISETTDEELARRLQYGNHPQTQRRPTGVRMMESTYKGRLQIDIVEAHLNKNYGFVKMDPYVKMTISNKVYETPTDYSGAKSPKWDKTIMCYIENNVDQIKFEVFDEKSFTDDEMIAVVKFPIPAILYTQGFIDEWLPLSGKLGEQKEGSINIRIVFTPIRKLQEFERRSSQPSLREIEIMNHRQANQEDDLARTLRISAEEAEYKVNEEEFKSLCEMFPTFDVEVVRSSLIANNGNKETTIEKLIEMS